MRHAAGAAIWLPLCLEGGHATRMEGGGVGLHARGFYPISLQRAYHQGFKTRAAELSYTNKFYVLFGVRRPRCVVLLRRPPDTSGQHQRHT